jgi:poly-gamma-glutamate synthesis protein (capsule biosynthesis protein)
VFAFCTRDSGVQSTWGATEERAGVHLLPNLSARTGSAIARQVQAARRGGDIVVASIHWGGNWGYEVPAEQRAFAHRLIDEAGVDVVFGHSSHHAKGIEIHRGKLVLYGCGDFIDDYEGIEGHEGYRADLPLMYFATLDADSGRLLDLTLVPLHMRKFRLEAAAPADRQWLLAMLNREGQQFGTLFEADAQGRFVWSASR